MRGQLVFYDTARLCDGFGRELIRAVTVSALDSALVGSLQSPAIAIAIARDCYILVVFLCLFFSVHEIFDVPGPIFAKLCHTTRYVLK